MTRPACRRFAQSLARRRGSIFSYGVSILVTLLAQALGLAVRPHLELNVFTLFLGAVFLSAWYGGLGPGLFSAVLSILAVSYFFLPPQFSFTFSLMEGGIDLIVFGGVTIVISSLSARLKEANAHLETAQADLENRIRERTLQLSTEIENRIEAEKAILEISHREQVRMGQDLHDGLLQNLVGMRLIAETLTKRLTKAGLMERTFAEQMERHLSDALARTDALSRGLYPVELENNGLMAALQELAQNLSNTHAVECRVVARQPILLENGAFATHLFRIAQEAATNAIKSGKATRIGFRIFRFSSRLVLAVVDNGHGLPPPPLRNGMGLHIIRYRCRILNAAFLLRNRARGGTTALCSVNTQTSNKLWED